MNKINLPKSFVTIYDNQGESLDRYTIVFNQTKGIGIYDKNDYDCICASEHGLGVFTWSKCSKGKHLGKKIEFSELSTELQNLILDTVVYDKNKQDTDIIEYHRKPTQFEIKMGYGATHYKSFDKLYCMNNNNTFKKSIVCPISNIKYYI